MSFIIGCFFTEKGLKKQKHYFPKAKVEQNMFLAKRLSIDSFFLYIIGQSYKMCKTKVKLNFQLEKWVKTKAAEGNQNKL